VERVNQQTDTSTDNKGRLDLSGDARTNRRTDRIAIAYTRYSIYAVARKKAYGGSNDDVINDVT